MIADGRPSLGALAAACGIGVVVTLTACAPEPEPEPELLSVTEAGGVYLEAVCPVNGAWDDVDVEVDKLRIALARGDGSEDPGGLESALEELADVSAEAADRLDPGRYEWPAEAEAGIALVRESLLSDAEQAAGIVELPAEEAVEVEWEGGDEAREAASDVRAALGLPEGAAAACEQWESRAE